MKQSDPSTASLIRGALLSLRFWLLAFFFVVPMLGLAMSAAQSAPLEVFVPPRGHDDELVAFARDATTGTIAVVKQTIPANATPDAFQFVGNASGTIGDNQRIVVGPLAPGTYTAQEIVPPGWNLERIVCDDVSGPSDGDLSTGVVTFDLEAGEFVSCTFTNVRDDVAFWDDFFYGDTGKWSSSAGAPAPCDHGICTPGGPLNPACNACVSQVCTDDPFCCNTGWDIPCVSQVRTTCFIDCTP